MANNKEDLLKSWTVKLTLRLPIDPNVGLMNSLPDFYAERQSIKGKKIKRIRSTLKMTDNNMQLTRGSWWPGPFTEPILEYSQILKSVISNGKPPVVILLASALDKSQNLLIGLKTKNANEFINLLNQKVNEYRETLPIVDRFKRQDVRYNVQDIHPINEKLITPSSNLSLQSSSDMDKTLSSQQHTSSSIKKSVSGSPLNKPFSEIVSKQIKPNMKNQQSNKLVKDVHPDKNIKVYILPKYENHNLSVNKYQPSEDKNQTHKNSSHNSDDNTTFTSVTYYGKKDMAKLKQAEIVKPVKQKRRNPKELDRLNDDRKTTTEFDENNIPWEVNISYIKHEPSGECIEDESGPIYMYAAHQLVSRTTNQSSVCDSNNCSDSSDDSESENSIESDESEDENELEKFMIMERDSQINNQPNSQLQNSHKFLNGY